MLLCKNRPEGFGPHSNLHSSLPTTCFIDVIVVPLATWLYLLLAAILLLPLLFRLRRTSASTMPDFTRHDDRKPHARRNNIWRVVLRVLYYFFVLAVIAMVSLEIARMVDAKLGVGLLPFMYPGILLAAGLHGVMSRRGKNHKGALRMVRVVNAIYWLLLAVVFAIKVAVYVKEGIHSRDGMVPQDNYKVVDEVTDVGVMIFLAAVLVLLEFVAS